LDWLVQPVVHKAERKSSPSLVYVLFLGVPQAILLGEADFGFQSKPHNELIITFRFMSIGKGGFGDFLKTPSDYSLELHSWPTAAAQRRSQLRAPG
jgi:hypothetical protein